MQAAYFFKRQFVAVFGRFFRPCPRLFFATPKKAEFFKLAAVRVRIKYPYPQAANFNFAMKIYNCVYYLFETVGNVGAAFLFFGVGLAIGGLGYVANDF